MLTSAGASHFFLINLATERPPISASPARSRFVRPGGAALSRRLLIIADKAPLSPYSGRGALSAEPGAGYFLLLFSIFATSR